ncbi:tRNA guanosine-2'-O-methyltransferase [Oleiphilus messinensis]|uniref:tRNA (guanosine(18)-2'-O)-methyltransferase n=1 Tax=Oleiphilus messinensis TaxID=141451 RepID=A0A1Y0I975_9GAMM|nr:tRNA (guanosine(18)-2'-O)-methyltransferase TrmH [Oleiphilus messinensis]ARU55943.1 tRNA guanosine-2'-O-methyltransferase [Oleiphilus messinensis]
MTPERYKRLRETLDRRQSDLTILTDQMHKPRNIAALIRTADAVGIADVHMVWSAGARRPYKGTALGSQRWVKAHTHDSMADGINGLRQQGYQIYAAHLSEQAVNFRSVDYTRPCAVVLGNEKQGVGAVAESLADEHIIIPMMGMVESYNVSVAAAIILAEAQRQREAVGQYNRVSLTDDVYWQLFFEWAHPQVAQFCREKGVAYPGICRDSGEIIEPAAWYRDVRAESGALK